MDPGRARRDDGFTLVELLTVLAVLAALAALLLPVLGRARERALEISCLSRVHQLSVAYALYMDDWDQRFPSWFFDHSPRPAPYGRLIFWPEFFRPYLRSEKVLFDPSVPRTEATSTGVKLADYCYFSSGLGGKGTSDDPYLMSPGREHTIADIVRPAETATIMDGFTTPRVTAADQARHRLGMNAAFVDGHVGRLRLGELLRVVRREDGFHYYVHMAADR